MEPINELFSIGELLGGTKKLRNWLLYIGNRTLLKYTQITHTRSIHIIGWCFYEVPTYSITVPCVPSGTRCITVIAHRMLVVILYSKVAARTAPSFWKIGRSSKVSCL